MWTSLAHLTFNRRRFLIILLGSIVSTIFYCISLNTPNSLGKNRDWEYFKNFNSKFRYDPRKLAMGIKDSSLYTLKNFNRLRYLTDEIAQIKGVKEINTLPVIPLKDKNGKAKQISKQTQLDSSLTERDKLVKAEDGVTLILISLDETSDTKRVFSDLKMVSEIFEDKTGIKIYSTAPSEVGFTNHSLREIMKISFTFCFVLLLILILRSVKKAEVKQLVLKE